MLELAIQNASFAAAKIELFGKNTTTVHLLAVFDWGKSLVV